MKKLLDGVPRDDWFVLKNKKGTKDMGELHLQVMYLKKDEDMTKEKDEFPYPLQTLLRKQSFQAWATYMEAEPDIDKPDRKGQTGLHVCAELALVKQLEVLLQRNADVSVKDENEQTALHTAAISGCTEAATALIEMEAQVNAKDKNARTPLHIAVIHNKDKIAEILLEKGASVSAQDEDGNTPLHLALAEGSKECIPLLIEKGADIYLENAKGQSSCALSVVVGEDNESVQQKFFEAISVVDSREFELKRKYKHRTIVGGKGLSGEDGWQKENPQFCITGSQGAEIHLILHYDDPISKTTQPMEKCSFITFPNEQTKFKELSYWHENIIYGRVDPISLTLAEDTSSNCVIPYSKSSTKLTGNWSLVAYSDTEINISEVVAWPFKETIEGKWEGESAGGCITEQETFSNNPKFVVELPSQTVQLACCLGQQKNMGDVEPFSIVPYKFYMGLYIFDKDVTDPIDRDPIARTTKFKNGRENNGIFSIDGSKHSKVIVIPSTHKPGECGTFTLQIASDVEVKISTLDSLPKSGGDTPKKKKKKKKKSKE
mmetsp:Transcript_22625/g.34448  ORF Transcript_22625/g.34448 Transcript_22625/m.34448 type:complete len:546 (+) Transcript_22625:41-1678(+)